MAPPLFFLGGEDTDLLPALQTHVLWGMLTLLYRLDSKVTFNWLNHTSIIPCGHCSGGFLSFKQSPSRNQSVDSLPLFLCLALIVGP